MPRAGDDYDRMGEIHRALGPDGRMVLSIHHPGEDWRWFDRPDYFATEPITDTIPTAVGQAEIHFFRRPLSAVFAAVRDAGFWVDELAEPMPRPEVQQRDPRAWTLLTTQPRFLYLRLLKRGTPWRRRRAGSGSSARSRPR